MVYAFLHLALALYRDYTTHKIYEGKKSKHVIILLMEKMRERERERERNRQTGYLAVRCLFLSQRCGGGTVAAVSVWRPMPLGWQSRSQTACLKVQKAWLLLHTCFTELQQAWLLLHTCFTELQQAWLLLHT